MGQNNKLGRYKDPGPSVTALTFQMLFSRPLAGAIASALSVRWLTPYMSGVRLPMSFTQNVLSRRWQTLIGSAIVGFGLGYGMMAALHWTRMQAIATLLSYKGWLFNPNGTSTKLWGIALKVLIGPGPHKLHEFEDVMPHLPVPDLNDTCDRYLMTVKPLLTEDEYLRTEHLIKDLLANDGPLLQDYLIKKSKKTKNWLADWWLTDSYLSSRDPIALNVNFYMMSGVTPEVSTNSLARIANILHDTLRYYEMIKNGTLPPDMIRDIIPTCMDGVRFMMASTRIPGEHIDRLQVYPDSTHIIVISNGVYYKMDMYPTDEYGKRKLMNKHEIRDRISKMWEESKDVRDSLPIAVLTAQNRTKWAKDRDILMSKSADVLESVESAILITVLGNPKPGDMSAMAKEILCGNGASRWFDKSLVLEVWQDVAMGGGNMEHSGTDATHFAVMWEHVLQLEEYGPDGDLVPLKKGETVRQNLPQPQRLNWTIDSQMKDTILQAYDKFKKRSSELDLVIMYSDFGRGWMKSRKISPDGFIQMSIQLAFKRMHGCFTKTYEPASHRLFTLGRTDNINPFSMESIKFIKTMHDKNATTEQKVNSLRAAVNLQNRARLEATAGYGCDRHMLGLFCAARELGRDIPEVFNDKAFRMPMRLSTSQVPSNLGHLELDLIPESITGGFGPTCDNGYGVLYVSVGENMYNFSITSWKSCRETDSRRFGEMIRAAMQELKDLLDGKEVTVITMEQQNITAQSK